MKSLSHLLAIAVLSLFSWNAFSADQGQSQDSFVTCVVSDNVGPMPGASVMVKGTKAGETTGSDGKATIRCSGDAVLVVSFIGYQTVEIPVNGRTEIRVTLKDDSLYLDETVVL